MEIIIEDYFYQLIISDAKNIQKDGIISFNQEFENDMVIVLTGK